MFSFENDFFIKKIMEKTKRSGLRCFQKGKKKRENESLDKKRKRTFVQAVAFLARV